MNKFEQKVHDIALEVGGSHYPAVNPDLHKQMVRAVIDECVRAIDSAKRTNVYTTYDNDMHTGMVEKIKQSINERFGL
jgi:hypothetical protein